VGQLTPLIAGKSVAFDTGPLIYYLEEHLVVRRPRQRRRSWDDQRAYTPRGPGETSSRGPQRSCREIPGSTDKFGECKTLRR